MTGGTISSSVTAGAAPSRTATGRVVDAATGYPIPGALVHAAGHLHRASADEDGRFRLTDIGEDALGLIAGAPGYTMSSQPLESHWDGLSFELHAETPRTVPHPDYPRPDFDRRAGSGGWATLNGTWRLAFDQENRGLREHWANGADYPHLVVVPFSYCSLAGLGEQARASNTVYASQFATRRGVVWYWREFTVPADFAPERHTLVRFGAVEWHSTVFLDGAQLSKHDGGYTPFEVDLGVLAPGSTHSIAVRVVVPDNSAATPYPQGKQTSWYTDNGGIWQSVWLEQADPVRVRTLSVHPELEFDGTDVTSAAIAVRVSAQRASTVRLRVRAQQGHPGAAGHTSAGFPRPCEPDAGELVAERAVSSGDQESLVRIEVPEPRLWDPERPWLYLLEAAADGETGRDEVHTWFGLRSITREWAPGHAPSEQDEIGERYQYLMLNNRPIQLRSVLDQAFNPWGNYSYTGQHQGPFGAGTIAVPGKGSVLFDLALTKQLGFNSARLHIKVNDPLYYHWADVLGVLVFYDLPNFGYRGFSPTAEQLFESVLVAAVRRDFNHPSIVIWDVINEAWGVGGGWAELAITDTAKPWIERMVARTRELLDDTRLVVDNSPCCNNFHQSEDTDLLDFHGYYSTWDEWVEVLDDYVANTYPGSTHNMEPGRRQRGQPLLNSEYGPWSGGAEMDQEVATPFRYTTELFRTKSTMAGYLFTELTDLEWEWNGWAAYDRTLEVPGYSDAEGESAGVASANADDVLLVGGPPWRRVHAGERLDLAVLASLFSHRQDTEFVLRWRMLGTDRTGARLPGQPWQQRTVDVRRYTVTELGTVPVTVPDGLVSGQVALELVRGNDVVATGQTSLLVTSAGVEEHELALHPSAATGSWPMGGTLFEAGTSSAALGYGDGVLHWELPAPDALSGAKSVQLLAEVSAQRPELPRTRFPQTSERRYPSMLEATVDGAGSRRVLLPDAPADARGVFSHAAGFDPGRYGYRVLLNFDADRVRAATADDGTVRVSLAGFGGGLALFGAGTGRYGITPRLVFGAEPLPGPVLTASEGFEPTAEGAGVSTYLVAGRSTLGEAGRMILNVVNDSPHPVTGVRPVLMVPPGVAVRPDVESFSGFTLAPGESFAARYTVTPGDTRTVVLRTKAHYDGPAGRQVSQRDWVVTVTAAPAALAGSPRPL